VQSKRVVIHNVSAVAEDMFVAITPSDGAAASVRALRQCLTRVAGVAHSRRHGERSIPARRLGVRFTNSARSGLFMPSDNDKSCCRPQRCSMTRDISECAIRRRCNELLPVARAFAFRAAEERYAMPGCQQNELPTFGAYWRCPCRLMPRRCLLLAPRCQPRHTRSQKNHVKDTRRR